MLERHNFIHKVHAIFVRIFDVLSLQSFTFSTFSAVRCGLHSKIVYFISVLSTTIRMSSIRKTLIQTANNYITSFNSGTPEGFIAHRTPDCVQKLLPSSLPPPWNGPPRTNEEYQAFVIGGSKLIRNIQLSLIDGEDLVVDEAARKVLLPLKSTGETDVGPYANEYMMLLKMTEDGKMIKEIFEFLDSHYTLGLLAKLVPDAAAAAGEA